MTGHAAAPIVAEVGEPADTRRGRWWPPPELADSARGLVRQFGWNAAKPAVRSVGLLGCSGGEGVSTLAAALAIEAAAARHEAVLLVDTHLARPAVHVLFGARPGPGLSEALQDGVRLGDLVQPSGVPHLSILAVGQDLDDADVGTAIAGLVEAITEEFALVVWDLPPAVGPIPAVDVTSHLDGLVLVVEAERTPLESAHRAAASLHARGRLLGAVLNKRPAHTPEWLTRLL